MNRTHHRRAAAALIAAVAAMILAACGGQSDDAGDGMDHGAGDPATSTSTAAFNDADVMFAQMMIPHHEQAVAMAELAETRAQDPELKELAADIKAAQAPEIETMTGWLTAWGQPTEAPMSHGADGMMSDDDMAALAAAEGTAFDKAFAEMMIEHHNGAIAMAETESAQGVNPEAVALAGDIAAAQTAEVETLTAILDRL